ncbi:kinase A anchor protein, partial [Armillaria nabsnona]
MARPTHFLSIPLGQTHPNLRARVTDLHAALNLPTPDSTLLVGPQRMHLTLGVMNLTPESLPIALDLLHRLPTLLPLTAAPPTITLDTLDVLKRESHRRAHVLWVGPSQPEPLFSQINQIFRDEGFITDTRPLKLHMTLMNSTYRRPRTKRPQPFEYDAILRQAG